MRPVLTTGLARSVRILVVAVLALALTGCLRYHVDLTVGSDERVSGTVIFAIKTNDPNITQTGGIPEVLSDKVTSRRYNQDGYLGEQITLDGLTFDEVERLFDSGSKARGAGAGNGTGVTPTPGPSGLPIPAPTTTSPPTGAPSGSAAPSGTPGATQGGQEPANRSTFSFRRDGDQVRVEGLTTFPFFRSGNVQQDFDAKITLTFPGDIVSTNGTKKGRSVTWTVSPTKPTQISVVANLTDKQPAWVLYALIGGGAAVVLVVVVLVVWMARRRRAAVPDGAAPVFDAAEFQTFLDDGGWSPSGYPSEPQAPPPGGVPPWAPPPGQAPQQVPAGPGLGTAPVGPPVPQGPPAPPYQQPPAYPPPPPAQPAQPAQPPGPSVPPGYGPPPGYPPPGPPPQGPPPSQPAPPYPPPPYPQPPPGWPSQGGPGPAPWPPQGAPPAGPPPGQQPWPQGGPPSEQQQWPQEGAPPYPPPPQQHGLSGPPVPPDQEWRPPHPEKP